MVVNILGTKQDVDTFVHEISGAEKDRDTRRKLSDLQLSPDEWGRVKILLDLLSVSERAQQSFSSDRGASVHLVLPALEAMHKAWLSRTLKSKYINAGLVVALDAGIKKIGEYYERSAESDAYIVAMCKLISLARLLYVKAGVLISARPCAEGKPYPSILGRRTSCERAGACGGIGTQFY
jgi:hypothetical protein